MILGFGIHIQIHCHFSPFSVCWPVGSLQLIFPTWLKPLFTSLSKVIRCCMQRSFVSLSPLPFQSARKSGNRHKRKSSFKTESSMLLQNNKLSNRIQDLEGQIDTERELRISAVMAIEKQRDEARKELSAMEKEYSDLLDLKLKLDHEISVYRKLLEEEEQRLGLFLSCVVANAARCVKARHSCCDCVVLRYRAMDRAVSFYLQFFCNF